jgi:hypothetical protein
MRFLVLAFVIICLLQVAIFTPPALADAIYSYTGNAFDNFSNDASKSMTGVSGSFTMAAALAPNQPYQAIFPVSYSFTNGIFTWTMANSNPGVVGTGGISVATGASGQITQWYFRFVDEQNGEVVSYTISGGYDISLMYSGGQFGYMQAWNNGSPGNWTGPVGGGSPAPLPPSLLLLAPGLAGLAAVRRRFKK